MKPILLKTLFAAAVISAGTATAFAQGVPPNPDVANPALGAGHQTQNDNPVGVTGTPHAQDKTQNEGVRSNALGANTNDRLSTRSLGAGNDTGVMVNRDTGTTNLSNDNTMRNDNIRQPATRGMRADRH